MLKFLAKTLDSIQGVSGCRPTFPRHILHRTTTLAIFASSAVFAQSLYLPALNAQSSERPNIVLILADDMGLDSVSAFNDQLGLKTDSIDRLAREGMAFTDAHSTSGVCSPTRYSVLTGRYHWRSRLKRGIVGKWERPLIESERVTLPEMLRSQGYATACIGKWHLGWNWPGTDGNPTQTPDEIDFSGRVAGGPIDHGFDSYFGDDVPNWPPYVWRENDRLLGELNSTMKAGTMLGVNEGPAVADWDFRAVLSEYAQRCTTYIHGRKNSPQPFFLFFAMPSPHTPIAPHAEFQGKSGVSEYADFLLQTDAVIGQLLKALDETGQAENTVVIFTCDNGTSPKANFEQLEAGGIRLNEHWRGWKSDVFEGGHRVPFVVRWPGQIEAGSRSDQVVPLTDILATCADIVQFKIPDNMAEDSVSLLPTLTGHPSAEPLHPLVVHHSGGGQFAVREGRWKLLFCRGSGGWSPPIEKDATQMDLPDMQLYDLQADSRETTNCYADHPEVVSRLKSGLRKLVEQGRSTPGAPQPNHAGKIWWNGLPWEKSE